MKKRLVLTLVFILLGISISACTSITKPQEVDSVKNAEKEELDKIIKDELNIPLTKIDTLDPLKNNNFSYYNFSKLIYQSLFEFDQDLKPVPLLVEDYNIEDEGKTIVIQLKEGIYWHDGDKLTSKDVDFTIRTIKDLKMDSIYKDIFSSALGGFSPFDIKNGIKTEIISDSKIKIYFNNTYVNILEVLTFPIVNEKSYSAEDGYKPIGTGPFTFSEYNSSKGIHLIKNYNYWDGGVIVPKVNGRIFSDADLMFKAFEDGRVDFSYDRDLDLEKYKKNPNINIIEYISSEYEFLGYNLRNKLFAGEDGKLLRKAIYYAIDRQAIIHDSYLGHATQVDTPIHPDSYLTERVTNVYGYNIEKSKGILKDLGFKESESDGILKDRFGRRLSFKLITNFSNPYRRDTALMIKEDLKEVGIELVLNAPSEDLKSLSEEEIDKEWENLNKDINRGNYDLVVLGWELSALNDPTFMFHSSFISSGSNFIHYKNSEMDNLLKKTYFSSLDEKIGGYIKIQEKVMEELPYASLFFVNKALLSNSNIEGDFKPTFFNLYRGIEKCTISR